MDSLGLNRPPIFSEVVKGVVKGKPLKSKAPFDPVWHSHAINRRALRIAAAVKVPVRERFRGL